MLKIDAWGYFFTKKFGRFKIISYLCIKKTKRLNDMGIKLENPKVWEKFCEFFREEKGYSDWTDEQIDYSRNDDDIEEFIEWLIKQLED